MIRREFITLLGGARQLGHSRRGRSSRRCCASVFFGMPHRGSKLWRPRRWLESWASSRVCLN